MRFYVPLLAVTVFPMLIGLLSAQADPTITVENIRKAPGEVRTAENSSSASISLDRAWEGPVCASRLTNRGNEPVRIREVVLFHIAHSLPPDTVFYGEGFTMLSQTAGTLGQPVDVGGYTDRGHYRIPQPDDATTVYGMMVLSPEQDGDIVLGFTSCNRFVGKFYVRSDSIEAVLDTENLPLAPGASWELERFWAGIGGHHETLLEEFAGHIASNHPPLFKPPVPAGWCSWYCFGPNVTTRKVERNLNYIAETLPELNYVQIDDGYQAAMGDWLDTGKAFGGGIREVIRQIRETGREPAIWVAPFIAEEASKVFREHPDWFIMDAGGRPLRSDAVTFGGWRNGPWYALDGTVPEAQQYLESVFRTMRQEWGCSYFKLDANFWGAMHGGRFHDPEATRVEAYRRGMAAVLRGAGDGFLLGCNHPMWPSLGLIHGSRSSGDTERRRETMEHVARETFHRNWQNGRLWWNDPDCVLLTGGLADHEFMFHAAAIYASGGMVLSGDDLPRISPERLQVLRKLVPPTGVAARFEDHSFQIGRIMLPDREVMCIFNWTDELQTVLVPVGTARSITDFWSGEALPSREGLVELSDLPPHTARLLSCAREQ